MSFFFLFILFFSNVANAACPDELVKQLAEFYVETVQGADKPLALSSLLDDRYEGKLREAVAQHRESSTEALHAKVVNFLRQRGGTSGPLAPEKELVLTSPISFKLVEEMEWDDERNSHLAVHPDGFEVAVATRGHLHLFDPAFKESMCENHDFDHITAIEYSNDRSHILIIDDNKFILLDQNTLTPRKSWPQNSQTPGPCLKYGSTQSPDGRYFLGGSTLTGPLYLRDLQAGPTEKPIRIGNRSTDGMAATFLNDGKHFLLARANDKTLGLWLTEGKKGRPEQIMEGPIHGLPVGMSLLPDEKKFLMLYGDGRLVECHSQVCATLRRFEEPEGGVDFTFPLHPFAVSKDGRIAIGASRDEGLVIWNVGTGNIEQQISYGEGKTLMDAVLVETGTEKRVIGTTSRQVSTNVYEKHIIIWKLDSP